LLADAIMWWVNIAFGVFAALVHVPISNEPYAEELLEGRKTKATGKEAQVNSNTATAKVESNTAENMP
jgi:hypothetical protein